MLLTPSLLALTPVSALVAIINAENSLIGGQTISSGSVNFIGLTPLNGRTTQVTVKAKPPQTSLNGVPATVFTGSKTFTYQRIDLNTFFNDLDDITFNLNLPTTTYAILNYWQMKYGFAEGASDFIIETIPIGTTSFTIRAVEGSLRWVGRVTVSISPPLPSINQILPNNILAGLHVPNPLL